MSPSSTTYDVRRCVLVARSCYRLPRSRSKRQPGPCARWYDTPRTPETGVRGGEWLGYGPAMTLPRNRPPFVADERTQLVGWFDMQRAIVQWKCEGLSEEDAHRSVLSSSDSRTLAVRGRPTRRRADWILLTVRDAAAVRTDVSRSSTSAG